VGVEKDNEDQKLIKPEWIRGTETIIEEENQPKRKNQKSIGRGQKGSKSSKRIKEGRNKNVER